MCFSNWYQKRLFLIIITFVSFCSNVFSAILPNWNLLESEQYDSEYLLYQLSYSGLLTAFVWTDLANVAFQTKPTQPDFNGFKNCALSMKVSTEKYPLAETLRATRFDWRNKISPDFNKVHLVEKVDLDAKIVHEVTWVDWGNNKLEYYKIPEINEGYISDLDNEYDPATDIFSELKPSKIKNILSLSHTPDLHQDKTQLIRVNSLPLSKLDRVLDPLSFLYVARWNDYENSANEYIYDIAYKDEIRQYSLHYLGKEVLMPYDKPITTYKVEAKRRNDEEAEEEGFMVMWITDNDKRIPIKYLIDGVIGEIRVKIINDSLLNYKNISPCTVRQ